MDSIQIKTDAPVEPTKTVPNTVTTATGGQQIVPPKADETAPITDTSRPAGMPEKFKTVDELVKAYGELEKKMGTNGTPAAEPTKPAAEATPAAKPDETAAAAELHKFAAEAAGGADKLPQVLEWAKTNLSKDEQAAYNAAVDTGNVALVKLAMTSVVKQYDAANGKAPALINGEAPAASASGVQPFASNREMTTAMKDPRYKNDPAYVRMVQARVAGMK